jgi:MFS family permease
MTAALLGGMLLQLPIGRLSDRLDRRLVIFGVTIGVSIPAFALVLGEFLPSWGTLTAVAIFFGLASTLYPLSIAYANDYLDPGDVVAASGGFIMIFSVGAVAGPIAASAAMRIAGPQGMFIYIMAIVVLLTAFIAWRMRVRQWAPVVEKEPYVLQPELQAPGVISELDPRAEVDEGYDQGPDILDTPTAEAEEDTPFGFWLGLFGIKPEDSNEPDADPEPTEPLEVSTLAEPNNSEHHPKH